MSPILVRPVREQLEHDRVIRVLQNKYKRKFEVAINPGNEQTMPVGAGGSTWYPDLVLQNADRGRKLAGVVEVETAESVNNLEAMSQWATFARLRVPFHLYLPTGSVDSARRFCADLSIPVSEMWAYQAVGDQLRFTLVQKDPSLDGAESKERAEPSPRRSARPQRPARAATGRASAGAKAARPSRARSARTATASRRPAAKTKSAGAGRSASKSAASRKSRPAASSKASKRR